MPIYQAAIMECALCHDELLCRMQMVGANQASIIIRPDDGWIIEPISNTVKCKKCLMRDFEEKRPSPIVQPD